MTDQFVDALIQNKQKKEYVKHERDMRDREPVPECVRYSICPKCNRRLHIERIPFTMPRLYDVACLCGCRVPLPEGYSE